MSQPTLLPATAFADPASYAAASFLARYRGATLRAYKQDLRAFFTWCVPRQLLSMAAERPHLELYVRWMEQQSYAPSTIGRRFATVAGFYKYAVIDGHLSSDPTLAVTRPKVPWEGQKRAVLHLLEFAALLTASRRDDATSHALVALLGMIGLRVSEACSISVTDLRFAVMPDSPGVELVSRCSSRPGTRRPRALRVGRGWRGPCRTEGWSVRRRGAWRTACRAAGRR